MKGCEDAKAPADAVIARCTALIRSGQLSRGDTAMAHYNRGVGYQIMRDDDLAIADYTTAIRFDPKFANAYNNRGVVYLLKREPNHAIVDFTAAIRIDPDLWGAHYARGSLYFDKAQFDLAGADFLAAIVRKEYPRAHAGLGRVFFLQGSYAYAADELRTAMRLAPHDEYIWLSGAMADLRADGALSKEAVASAAGLNGTKWPAPVVAFYMGKETAGALRSDARSGTQRCEAAFYIAEMALSRHDDASGRRDLQRAVATCPHRFVEYLMARTELASGGRPRVVNGVDFDELTFRSMRFHRGVHAGTPDYEVDTKVMEVMSGRVGGRTVAVAWYRYVPPATGYSETVEAFLVEGGKATWLATLGEFAYFNDSGPGVDPWILVSFAGDKLVADVWNISTRCNPKRDWIVTSYTVQNAKLRPAGRVAHHRAELAVDCR